MAKTFYIFFHLENLEEICNRRVLKRHFVVAFSWAGVYPLLGSSFVSLLGFRLEVCDARLNFSFASFFCVCFLFLLMRRI